MIPDVVSIYAPGIPVPQGSKQIVRRGAKSWLIDVGHDKLHTWRANVAGHARQVMDGAEPFDEPVKVRLTFRMPRPKRPKFKVPGVRPDIDKLTRAVLDAITGPVLVDDSLVVELTATQEYDEKPGVHVHVAAW